MWEKFIIDWSSTRDNSSGKEQAMKTKDEKPSK